MRRHDQRGSAAPKCVQIGRTKLPSDSYRSFGLGRVGVEGTASLQLSGLPSWARHRPPRKGGMSTRAQQTAEASTFTLPPFGGGVGCVRSGSNSRGNRQAELRSALERGRRRRSAARAEALRAKRRAAREVERLFRPGGQTWSVGSESTSCDRAQGASIQREPGPQPLRNAQAACSLRSSRATTLRSTRSEWPR